MARNANTPSCEEKQQQVMESHKYIFKIAPQHVDFSGKLRITTLGNFLLNAAGWSAESFGFGISDLRQRNLAWVLARLHISIQEFPTIDDEIVVETWIVNVGHLITERHFALYKNDNVIGEATSLWSIIEFGTRKPIDLLLQADMSAFVVNKTASIESPQRIDELHDEAQNHHKVVVSDLDFNLHVNSMKYIEWVLDTQNLDFFEQQPIRSLDINYVREAHMGENIRIISKANEHNIVFCLQSAEQNSTICKAKITF